MSVAMCVSWKTCGRVFLKLRAVSVLVAESALVRLKVRCERAIARDTADQ